jgi:acetoin utilization deacetylase AcuC-like enzyme
MLFRVCMFRAAFDASRKGSLLSWAGLAIVHPASVRGSAYATIAAAKAVAQSGSVAYALCRPSGHHAYPDMMSGMCYLNNAGIGAGVLASHFGKVAILDIDIHHGDGTQFMFYDRPDILYCSLHADPRIAAPYFSGFVDECGEGAGVGTNINFVLPPGTDDAGYLEALDRALNEIRRFGAEAVVVSVGLDASEHDPMSIFSLSNLCFVEIGRRIDALRLPTLLVQEGGYVSNELGNCLLAFLGGFSSN